jgi:hypothetical protein
LCKLSFELIQLVLGLPVHLLLLPQRQLQLCRRAVQLRLLLQPALLEIVASLMDALQSLILFGDLFRRNTRTNKKWLWFLAK